MANGAITKNKWVVNLSITDALQIEIRADTRTEAEKKAVEKASGLNWPEYKKRLLRSTGFVVINTHN